MDPMTIMAIAQLAGLAVPIVARALGAGDRSRVEALLRGAVDRAGNIDVPALQQLVLAEVPPSELAGLREDPTAFQRETEADEALRDISDSGGLTLADTAALQSIREKVTRQESAGRAAIEQGLRARGHYDSGAQLAMTMQNQQDAANRLAEEGRETAAGAQKRSLEAILRRGEMAGARGERVYGRQERAAAAQDAINRGNVAIRNLATKYNTSLPQQQFENEMAKERERRRAEAGLGEFYGQEADEDRAMWQQIGEGVGNFGTGIGQYYGKKK